MERSTADIEREDGDDSRVFQVPWGALRVHSNPRAITRRPALRSLPGLELLEESWHFTGRRLVDFDRIDVWNPDANAWEPCHFWSGGGGPAVFVCLARWGTIQVHSGLMARWRQSVPIEL